MSRYITSYNFTLTSKAPLHIGRTKDSLHQVVEEVQGKEVVKAKIPATVFAGAFRTYLEKQGYVEEAKAYFGTVANKSQIQISDAIGEQPLLLEVRTGVRLNAATGVAIRGALIDRQYVAEGCVFNCALKANYDRVDSNLLSLEAVVTLLLQGLDNGAIRLGAYTSTGAGLFSVSNVKCYTLDLTDKKDLFTYIYNTPQYTDVVLTQGSTVGVKFILKATSNTALLVGGRRAKDNKLADVSQMSREQGYLNDTADGYIIPGTSLKGVLRNEVNKLVNSLGLDSGLVDNLFGSTDIRNASASKLFINDSLLTNVHEEYYNNIRVDKFTQGIRQGAKADNSPVFGDVVFKITYNTGKTMTVEDKKSIALLSLVLNDLALGNVAIGSGANIGRGTFKGSVLEIKGLEKDILVSYNDMDDVNEDILESYLDLVKVGV